MSDLSKLATSLWSHLEAIVPRTSKPEAAQAIVDLFIQAGCEDIYESVSLIDAARISILDDDTALGDFEDESNEESCRSYDCFDGGKEVY